MEIIKGFGLDPFLFGAQLINFLIVLYLLKRFLYKPVLDTLKKRERQILEGLKQAEEGKALLDKALIREKEILKKAREEAKKTINETKDQALRVRRDIEEGTKLEAEKIIREAREQIERETKEVEKRLVSQVSHLSVDFLRKSLSSMFSEKEQKEVLDRAVKTIKRPSS